MVTVTTLPARPFSRADLDAMPNDGHRYELIDGVLVVTPSPSPDHQRFSRGVFLLLHTACPDDLEVLYAPFDVAIADDTVMQPDLLVAARDDFTDRDLPVAPVLAVEILSPSTRRFDLTLKRSRYESAGTASYWVVDPDELSLTAWDLVDGAYVEVAHVTGEEEWTAASPFPVTIVPAALKG
ncbi:MAG: Uma2 family endonuclease [Nocardioides sp.]